MLHYKGSSAINEDEEQGRPAGGPLRVVVIKVQLRV